MLPITITSEAEAIGTERCTGTISIVYSGTWEREMTVTADGNVTHTGDNEVLDIDETSLWCSYCGRLDDYAKHGISEEWQET